jgi:hypothetical protein
MQDGGGLFLKVDGQSKSWVYRYQLKKKRRKIGFGPYPVISLKAALERHREAQVLVKQGTHTLGHWKALTRRGGLSMRSPKPTLQRSRS